MKRKRKGQIQPDTPFGLKPDYDMNAAPERERVVAGPNRFAIMKSHKQFYGRDFDYRVMDQEPGTNAGVWMPCSPIAQNWLWKEVGETQHWIRLDGYNGLHVTDVEGFNRAAERDGLINEESYFHAMEERDRSANDE